MADRRGWARGALIACAGMSAREQDARKPEQSPGTILVTGGAGYIGSHTVVELLHAGYDVVVVDDLSNSSEEALRRVAELAGRAPRFHRLDLNDVPALRAVFEAQVDEGGFEAVIHFAGWKAVGESVEVPLAYYRNNVAATVSLLEVMGAFDCRRLVFSSSCTVYGNADSPPLDEERPLGAFNPYGRTKLIIEDMLRDLAAADRVSAGEAEPWRISLLRYFNPVGAHSSGRIGEDPRGIPNNLMPYITQTLVGRREQLSVFGGDYPTRDGTCVRDYIHVVDLALGHVAALRALGGAEASGAHPYNLGTGEGYTVLEVVEAAGRAAGREVPYRIVDRRPGDAVAVWADAARAERILGWRATRTLDEMCVDALRWQTANPEGYGDA